ncbi:unnamed protein product [Mytilus coruscus]|uniref:Uncharacterized protein n=1 Tax=Mytilus coruscus TaxID=42192 RepID=A0A6J8E4A4_MYTCO|nr:unnamed protein product [Mytilus coruscus]
MADIVAHCKKPKSTPVINKRNQSVQIIQINVKKTKACGQKEVKVVARAKNMSPKPSTSMIISDNDSFDDPCSIEDNDESPCCLADAIIGRKRKSDVYPVRTSEFQSKIVDICKPREDEWALDLLGEVGVTNVSGIVWKHLFQTPLFWKALCIVTNKKTESDLKQIVLRLDGFHTEMSFLGSFGRLMVGSDLHEVAKTVYASNAVNHVLRGKAVSRAIRGLMMVENALHILLMKESFDVSLPCAHESDITEADSRECDEIVEKACELYN